MPNLSQQLIDEIQSTWGSRTLEEYRLEAERCEIGRSGDAIRDSGGRRLFLFLCTTRIDDQARALNDPPFGMFEVLGADWKRTVPLDLLTLCEKASRTFACIRYAGPGRPTLCLFAIGDSVSTLERIGELRSQSEN